MMPPDRFSPDLEESKTTDQIQPLLYVDVNIGPKRTERVVVYEGDTPEDLSVAFCQQFGLGPLM